MFMGMYFITGCLGITTSYHRQLSHRAFTTPKWVEYALAYCGVLSVQGDPLEWVSCHRYHHLHCETPLDPHSVYEGFWWSHMGWLLDDRATQQRVSDTSNAKGAAPPPRGPARMRSSPLCAARLTLAALVRPNSSSSPSSPSAPLRRHGLRPLLLAPEQALHVARGGAVCRALCAGRVGRPHLGGLPACGVGLPRHLVCQLGLPRVGLPDVHHGCARAGGWAACWGVVQAQRACTGVQAAAAAAGRR